MGERFLGKKLSKMLHTTVVCCVTNSDRPDFK